MSCNAISGGETKVWRGGSRCPGLQSSRCQAGGGTGANPCLQGGQSLARPGSPVSTDCVWYSGQGRGWWGLLTRMKGDPFATLECSWSSALRLAFSRPPSTSTPRKGTLCWGVLTVSSLPVVSGENSSLVLSVLMTLWVFPLGLPTAAVRDFSLSCVLAGGHGGA